MHHCESPKKINAKPHKVLKNSICETHHCLIESQREIVCSPETIFSLIGLEHWPDIHKPKNVIFFWPVNAPYVSSTTYIINCECCYTVNL